MFLHREDEDDVHEEDSGDELARVAGSHLSFRRKALKKVNLLAIYKEFYGLDEFDGVPIKGGFYGLEKKYKNSWRVAYQVADNTFFSRVKKLVSSLAGQAGVDEGELTGELVELSKVWQPFLASGGLAGAVTALQRQGLVEKKGCRSRVTAAAHDA